MTHTAVLVLDALPLPLHHGDWLRSYHLARALGDGGRCVLVALAGDGPRLAELRDHGVFEAIEVLAPRPGERRWQVHLRTDNGRYYRAGWPDWFEECRARLQACIDAHQARTVIAGKLLVAELAAAVRAERRILDDFDCYTLTLEREYAVQRRRMPLPSRLLHHLAWWRYRTQESRLAGAFDVVTTISPADAARLAQLSPAARLEVIPNGIDAALLQRVPAGEPLARSVVFWGNLTFEPNASAVRFFLEGIYRPWLAQRAVDCYIVGAGAPPWLEALAAELPRVTLCGFVEDLPGLVARMPVMVNPMVSGSGLKNKLLEAFALGHAVVSTAMGAEAVSARADAHYVCADAPAAFAEAVLALLDDPARARAMGARAKAFVAEHYTWEAIAPRWREVVFGMPRSSSSGP